MTTWYMIRDKVTGKHLPARKGRSYSSTVRELTDKEPPRLFEKQGHATQAMNCWKSGMIESHGAWKDGKMAVRRVPDRDNADLEVVKVVLTPA